MLTIFTPRPAPPLLNALIFAPVHAWTLCHADAMPLVTQARRYDYAGGVVLLHGANARELITQSRGRLAHQIAALDPARAGGAFGAGPRPHGAT